MGYKPVGRVIANAKMSNGGYLHQEEAKKLSAGHSLSPHLLAFVRYGIFSWYKHNGSNRYTAKPCFTGTDPLLLRTLQMIFTLPPKFLEL